MVDICGYQLHGKILALDPTEAFLAKILGFMGFQM